MKTETTTTNLPINQTVIIMGRSAFAGARGRVTGESNVITPMISVTLKYCNRVWENVAFMPHELHPVDERRGQI